MKCCVIRNSKGAVVAAYPLEQDGEERLEIMLEKGESTRVMDIPKKAMRDPNSFRNACEG